MLKFTLSNGSGAGTMASNASSSDAESLTSGQVNRLRQNWAVHEGINFIIFWMNPNLKKKLELSNVLSRQNDKY